MRSVTRKVEEIVSEGRILLLRNSHRQRFVFSCLERQCGMLFLDCDGVFVATSNMCLCKTLQLFGKILVQMLSLVYFVACLLKFQLGRRATVP